MFESCWPQSDRLHVFCGCLLLQIRELEKQYPAITSLRSIDLHPSSWISVAWYEAWLAHAPCLVLSQKASLQLSMSVCCIKCSANGCLLLCRYPLYMIPSSLSLKELAASFLTFHGLSTQLPSPADSCSRCRDEFWAAPRVFPDPSPDSWESRLARSGVLGLGGSTAPGSGEGEGRLEPVSKTLLAPFGMCGYKVKGDAWSDIKKFDRLRESADAWEKQMGVNHFDYNFFSQGFM